MTGRWGGTIPRCSFSSDADAGARAAPRRRPKCYPNPIIHRAPRNGPMHSTCTRPSPRGSPWSLMRACGGFTMAETFKRDVTVLRYDDSDLGLSLPCPSPLCRDTPRGWPPPHLQNAHSRRCHVRCHAA